MFTRNGTDILVFQFRTFLWRQIVAGAKIVILSAGEENACSYASLFLI